MIKRVNQRLDEQGICNRFSDPARGHCRMLRISDLIAAEESELHQFLDRTRETQQNKEIEQRKSGLHKEDAKSLADLFEELVDENEDVPMEEKNNFTIELRFEERKQGITS